MKSEDFEVQALRYQVSWSEEELSRFREKHLQSAGEAVGKLTSAEARAADAHRSRATLEQQLEAQRAESELTLLKPRLQQEILKLEGDVATLQRAAAQESALEISASDRIIEQLLDEIRSKEENLKRLKREKIDRQERKKRIYEEYLKLEKLETRASFSDSFLVVAMAKRRKGTNGQPQIGVSICATPPMPICLFFFLCSDIIFTICMFLNKLILDFLHLDSFFF